MELAFYKYQGTGNDFVIIDNRKQGWKLNKEQIAFLCNRRKGIGADGLMLLETSVVADFKMVYYNADGAESTMCGNGGRCMVSFAKELQLIKDSSTQFEAIDGLHEAKILSNGIIVLHMQDVTENAFIQDHFEIQTGSPHYVKFEKNVLAIDVVSEGRAIRNNKAFPTGINVNFVEVLNNNTLFVRTYERGVEDETLSCGTGVTAAAIAHSNTDIGKFDIAIKTRGGDLSVQFEKTSPTHAIQVWLKGETQLVFTGKITLPS
jgi:diaminopimelate epimerase